MANDQQLTLIEDETNLKVYSYKDRQYSLTQKDPYGFIFITSNKGSIPVSLSGAYTSFRDAHFNLVRYLESIKNERPVLKRKPVVEETQASQQ